MTERAPSGLPGQPDRRGARHGRLKRLKNHLLFWIARLVMGVLARAPARWATGAGAALGALGWVIARRERSRAEENLRRVFPDMTARARGRLARQAFVNLGRSAAECVVMPRLRPQLCTDRAVAGFTPGSAETLAGAVAEGRGVLFVTGHLGNWELMAAAVARLAPVSVLFKPSYDPRFTRLIQAFRGASGIECIDVTRAAHLRHALEALRRARVLGVLVDQPVPGGVRVPFLGQPAWTSPLVPLLSRRTGAPVICGSIRRVGGKGPLRHTIQVERCLLPAELSLAEAVQEASRPLERAIRGAPEQWTWSLDRWRSTSPADCQGRTNVARCN